MEVKRTVKSNIDSSFKVNSPVHMAASTIASVLCEYS